MVQVTHQFGNQAIPEARWLRCNYLCCGSSHLLPHIQRVAGASTIRCSYAFVQLFPEIAAASVTFARPGLLTTWISKPGRHADKRSGGPHIRETLSLSTVCERPLHCSLLLPAAGFSTQVRGVGLERHPPSEPRVAIGKKLASEATGLVASLPWPSPYPSIYRGPSRLGHGPYFRF